MNIQISSAAAARLHALLLQETGEEQLAVRVVPLTSGCRTPSFALELTEVPPGYLTVTVAEILFTCPPEEKEWLEGLKIDMNRDNGKFMIYHPHPPLMNSCSTAPE